MDWTSHGGTHVPPKNSSWSKIRKATKNGEPTKYKSEIHIESIERTAWIKGTSVSSFGKNVHYKVYDAGKIVGASEGIDTPYIRVKCS